MLVLRRTRWLSCLVFLLPFLLACSSEKEVLSGLSSQQSLEAVVSLAKGGVSASRVKTSSGREDIYKVLVNSQNEARALTILHEYGLPKAKQDSIDDFTRPQGFTPNSSQMENLRLDHALGLRIEQLLQNLPGVVGVKVLVRANLHSNSFGDRGSAASNVEKPGASVVLRYASNTNAPAFSEEEVRGIVGQAIPGISSSAIRIRTAQVFLPAGGGLFGKGDSASGELEKLAQLRPFVFRVPETEVERASLQIVFILLAVCVAGGIVGWVWGFNTMKSRVRRRRPTNAGDKSFFIEATVDEAGQRRSDRALSGKGQGRLQSPPPPKPPTSQT